MDENVKVDPVATTATDTVTENATEGAKELNAFQKFFADLLSGKKDESPNPDEASKTEEKPKLAAKTYTEEEFTAAIEAQKQKSVAEAAEQERLSKLTPEEKAKAMEQSAVTAAQTENARLQAELTMRDLHSEAVGIILQKGYPVGLAEMLDYSDKAAMQKSLDNLISMYGQSLRDGLNDKLRGKTPIGLGGVGNAENALKDQIAKNIRGGLI